MPPIKRLLPYLIPLLLFAAVILLMLRMQAHRTLTDSKYARDHNKPLPVNLYKVEKSALQVSLPTECVARANPMVRLSNPLAGRGVARTAARVGQQVKAGDLLLSLDDSREVLAMESGQGQIESLRGYVKAQQERTDYFQQMRTQGMGLERDYKQAAADLAKARVDLATAEGTYKTNAGERAKA